MLIQSKIEDKQWLWVNVPKTASTAVMRTFFPYMEVNEQTHNSYEELISQYGILDSFTTVRHPVNRFRSGLNHIFSVCMCGKCKVHVDKLPTTLDTILFIKDMLILKSQRKDFFRAVYKNGESDYWTNVADSIKDRFGKSITSYTDNCLRVPFIVSQTFLLEGPQQKLTIFKYENRENLSNFIKNKLGYNLDNTLYRRYPNNLGVDFSDPTLLYLLRELYTEDFQNFNY
jgi:hypothetical protein